jgi:hypothetical protein
MSEFDKGMIFGLVLGVVIDLIVLGLLSII